MSMGINACIDKELWMLSLLFLNKSSVAFLMLPFPKMSQGLASSKDHSMTFGNKKKGRKSKTKNRN